MPQKTPSKEGLNKSTEQFDRPGPLPSWTGGAATATGAAAEVKGTASVLGAGETLQEIEEERKVGKRAAAKGGVRTFSA